MSLPAIIPPPLRKDYSLTIGHFYFGALGHSHFGGTGYFIEYNEVDPEGVWLCGKLSVPYWGIMLLNNKYNRASNYSWDVNIHSEQHPEKKCAGEVYLDCIKNALLPGDSTAR